MTSVTEVNVEVSSDDEDYNDLPIGQRIIYVFSTLYDAAFLNVQHMFDEEKGTENEPAEFTENQIPTIATV